MFFVFFFSIWFQDKPNKVSFASEINQLTPFITMVSQAPEVENIRQDLSTETMSVWMNIAGNDHTKLAGQLGSRFIIIEKPDELNEYSRISLEDLSVDRSIVITINGLGEQRLREDGIGRVVEGNYYCGIPLIPTPTPTLEPMLTPSSTEELIWSAADLNEVDTNEDPVKSIELTYTEDKESGSYNTKLTFTLDTTYAYKIYEDDYNYYISLLRPKDVYDRIIVLDAGHGGIDSGTYSKGNDYLEKDMNLSMLLYLKEYLENEDIKIYYTRTTDRRLTLSQRVDLANAVEADLFLSIHCNSNLSSTIKGIEVLYNDKQNDWDKFNSKRFSLICLEEINALIGREKRGLVPRSHNVTIIGESKVPVALIEVAYMSNKDDLNFLRKEENRKAAALGMYNAIMRAYDELDKDENIVFVQKNEENHD